MTEVHFYEQFNILLLDLANVHVQKESQKDSFLICMVFSFQTKQLIYIDVYFGPGV